MKGGAFPRRPVNLCKALFLPCAFIYQFSGTMLELSKKVQISIEVGVEIFKDLIVNTYQGISGFVKDKNKERDFFGTATKKYIRRYY